VLELLPEGGCGYVEKRTHTQLYLGSEGVQTAGNERQEWDRVVGIDGPFLRQSGSRVGGFRDAKDGGRTAATPDARQNQGWFGDLRPRRTHGVRPHGGWLRESVAVRRSEQRHEKDAEQNSNEHANHACEEEVFHARCPRSDCVLLRPTARCGP